ncbi:MAG: peptidoglycan-binding protein [Leptolyngbya sp. SIO4C5]|nr:peptidoglycan-binding protein [Leptolyngbya sp. SIO4C5]
MYGPKTEQALSNFQQDSGLPATGNVDPFTVQRLQTPNLFSIESPSPATESQIPNFLPSTASTPAAATPVPQADSEATAASTPATEPVDTEPTAVSEFNPSQLLIPVILLLGLGAIGGGIVLVYRQSLRSGRPAKQLDKQAPAAHITDQSALIADSAAAVNGSQQNLEIQDQTDSTAALEETTRLPKLNIVETLVAELQSSDPAKRRQAIWELGQRGNSSAVQPLVNLIMDADSKERSLILAALSEIGTHTLKPMNRALALSLQDDNPEVRKNAIRDLTRIYDAAAQVSQMLAHVAEDEDPEVRETARWALGQLNRIRPLPSSEQRASLYDSVSPADFLPGEKTNS